MQQPVSNTSSLENLDTDQLVMHNTNSLCWSHVSADQDDLTAGKLVHHFWNLRPVGSNIAAASAAQLVLREPSPGHR